MLGPSHFQCDVRLFGSFFSDLFCCNLCSSISDSFGFSSSLSLCSLSGVLLGLSGSLLGPLFSALGLLGSLRFALGLALLLGSSDLSGTLSLGSSLTIGDELVGRTEFVGETLDASTSVDKLLLASVERMAGAADFDADFGLRGTRLERVAAAARHRALHVIRMDSLLHFISPFPPWFPTKVD